MITIGIVGPSCSGKSTIANLVAEQLDAPCLSLDLQPIKGVPHVFVNGIRTFERPQFYNGEKLAGIVQQLRDLRNGNDNAESIAALAKFTEYSYADRSWHERSEAASDYLVLEGFLLFQYPRLERLCDFKFYIDVPWDEMVRRRIARGRGDKSDASFFKIGQAETEQYVLPQKNLPGVIVLDGCSLPKMLVGRILTALDHKTAYNENNSK